MDSEVASAITDENQELNLYEDFKIEAKSTYGKHRGLTEEQKGKN